MQITTFLHDFADGYQAAGRAAAHLNFINYSDASAFDYIILMEESVSTLLQENEKFHSAGAMCGIFAYECAHPVKSWNAVEGAEGILFGVYYS